jgi:hypothetical protein
MAIISILHFYKRSKTVPKPRGSFKQLLCFKIIVFLNFLQTVSTHLNTPSNFHTADTNSSLSSTSSSLADIYTRINTLHSTTSQTAFRLSSCPAKLPRVAPFFLIAYSANRYIIRTSSEEERSPRGYHGGPLGIYAILSAINIIDIIGALVQGIKARGGGIGWSLGMQNPVNRFAEGGEQYQDFAAGRRRTGGRRSRRY